MVAVYNGSLKLDKVVGHRVDKNQLYTPVKFKKSTALPKEPRARKENANKTRDGLKK
jgi:hypothetical protein